MNEQLFEWEVTPSRREPRGRAQPELVNRPPGYHLIATTRGVIGFHRSRIPEASMASHGSCVTLCGHVGRRMDEYPARIPLCEECEAVHRRT